MRVMRVSMERILQVALESLGHKLAIGRGRVSSAKFSRPSFQQGY